LLSFTHWEVYTLRAHGLRQDQSLTRCEEDDDKQTVLATLAAINQASASAQDIQYRGDPNAEKRMTLLLKDWDPKPMLHASSHEVPRAKFYVIDIHNHVNDAEEFTAPTSRPTKL
jgi:hypothetical protein